MDLGQTLSSPPIATAYYDDGNNVPRDNGGGLRRRFRHLIHIMQRTDRQVSQDRTATWIALLISGGVVLLLAILMDPSWARLLFLATAVSQLSLGYGLRMAEDEAGKRGGGGLNYFEDCAPMARNLALAAVGVAQFARWEASHDILEGGAMMRFFQVVVLVAYAVYCIARRNSSQFRARTVAAFAWVV